MSNIDNYQQDIISYKTAGSTNAEILAWLENNGVSTSERTLERRLKAWGCRRNTNASASSIPISRVRDLFHVNLLSDSEIAAKLAEEYGLECTSNQIKEIRLAERLLWKNQSPTDQVTPKATTKHLIKEYVLTGSGNLTAMATVYSHPTISTLRSLPQCCGPTGKVNTAFKMSFRCRAIVYRRDASHTRAP